MLAGTGASNSVRSMSYRGAEVLGRIERRRRQCRAEAGGTGRGDGAESEPVGDCTPARAVAGATNGADWPSSGYWGAGRFGAAVFVAVEITKEVSALPVPVAADKPAEINDAPRRRRR